VSKYILVNGCSHTEGSECSTNWPAEFSKLADVHVENLAQGGSSNLSIMRRTIEYLDNHDPEEIHSVIIAWTTLERFEFSFDNELVDYSFTKQDSDKEELNKYFKFADLHLADWSLGARHTQLYTVLLENYLQNKGIPYMFFNMFNSAYKDQTLYYEYQKFNKYYKPNTGILEHYLDTYPEKFTDTKHAWDPIIHKQIAEELFNSRQWQSR